MSNRSIQVVADSNAIAAAAAEKIILIADGKTDFSIAFSGGSTPKALYELLATEKYSKRIRWKNWRIYFGDERCVPPTDDQSNYRMAVETLLDRVPIPVGQVFRMKGDADPQQAAIDYGRMLKRDFGDGGLDVVLLGMGDDGHTASLFPHTTALNETEHRCVANYVEKLKTWRITMSACFLNRARLAIVMVTGAGKAPRVEQVLQGPRDPQEFPIQMIEPRDGELLWLMDAAAAGMTQGAERIKIAHLGKITGSR
jgi:6-phosphogluconolactonase